MVDGRGVADGPDAVGSDVVGAGGVALEGRGGALVVDAVPGGGAVTVVAPAPGGVVVADGGLVPTPAEGLAAGEGPATPQPLPSASNATSSKQREPSPPLMKPVWQWGQGAVPSPPDLPEMRL